MGKVCAIDFGLKRIGIALSDASKTFSFPLGRIESGKNDRATAVKLLEFLKKEGEIEVFVIGLPLHLSGNESPLSKLTRSFASVLEEISQKKVVFVDERLTSKGADTMLREREMNRKNRTKIVDTIAATLILETYLKLIENP